MTTALRIIEVDRLDCRLVAHRWRFDASRGAEIDQYWESARRKNPSLYDGPVLLASRAEETTAGDGARVLRMELFETRFSRFLAWRDFGWPDESVFNCFSMPAVRSIDGAFLLGEMAPGHSNAGQIYFPGGTPDPSDVTCGGGVDLEGSLVRELAEETGLNAGDARARPGWTIVFDAQRIACIRRLDWAATAAVLRARARAFLAREEKPELADIHMFFSNDSTADPRLPDFMRGFLSHAFARDPSVRAEIRAVTD
ncbi:MAG: NUDIX hydrolase [Methylocystis sp.]|nr:NUDIX hydrolase [Methylocystis sp.]